ncbi:Hypothetical_protein [Hexamita inflata]|uniref:Hypothetical_protein n=1 Tax=Hexamita inflata TaxID=28002 RepID=A0ABP1J690_9EUKA
MQSAFTQRKLRHQICETKQESAQNCSFVCRYVFYQNYLRLSSICVQCFLDIKTNGFPENQITKLQLIRVGKLRLPGRQSGFNAKITLGNIFQRQYDVFKLQNIQQYQLLQLLKLQKSLYAQQRRFAYSERQRNQVK